MWLAGGVFLQPHPPHSSEVAAPLDDAVCEIQSQMLDVVEGQGSWRGRGMKFTNRSCYSLCMHDQLKHGGI